MTKIYCRCGVFMGLCIINNASGLVPQYYCDNCTVMIAKICNQPSLSKDCFVGTFEAVKDRAALSYFFYNKERI